MLHLKGAETVSEPYLRRRELLAGLALHTPAIDTPAVLLRAGAEVLTVATETGPRGCGL